jgi:hypothetical protein
MNYNFLFIYYETLLFKIFFFLFIKLSQIYFKILDNQNKKLTKERKNVNKIKKYYYFKVLC